MVQPRHAYSRYLQCKGIGMPSIESTTGSVLRGQHQRNVQATKRVPVARILLVEDEPVTAEVFARALANQGYFVHVVRDGIQALHALRDAQHDLLVLDLGLPTVSGIEVLRRLRQGPNATLPVVVVSGTSPLSVQSASELLQPGVWLEKPLRPRELIAAVTRLREQ